MQKLPRVHPHQLFLDNQWKKIELQSTKSFHAHSDERQNNKTIIN